ncbi:MAG TPA: HlyD family efflux transporter periplasmic adaptor subunit [Candidatus Binatia bacterium]|nr:HlyD family efflux transporter periplasmic adaptor subunit [Candidatus Binatia bacterium]
MKNWRWAIPVVVVALLAGIGVTMAARQSQLSTTSADVPLALVKRGELDLKVHTTGELRAGHSVTLAAPPIGGGALQITYLVHTGAAVKKGDVIVEFDPSEQRYQLEQSQSELLQAEQDIIKAKADAAVQDAKDQVALLKARFDVRQAELDVQKHELVSAIDAKKNELALDQAKRALAELEQAIKSHTTTGRVGNDLAREKWNKAKLAMDQAKQNIDKMRVATTMDGLVALQKNFGGDFYFSGQSIPNYHVGDQARPGSAIAQVIDPHELELSGKVSELERAIISVGQPVQIEFDALPARRFRGSITAAAGMVQRQFWDTDSAGKYDVSIKLIDADATLRPGLTAQITIVGDKKPSVLYIPRQALFLKDGKQVVFVKKAAGLEQFPIKVDFENESRAAVEGVKEGDAVALIDPTAPKKAGTSSATSGPEGGKL